MNKKNKINLRILPLLIFTATLSLSVKINSVYERIKDDTISLVKISTSHAQAEEKNAQETSALTHALERGGKKNSSTVLENPNSTFTQSEIVILQELAERREALDLRSKEIDKKAVQLKIAQEEIDKKLEQLKLYEQKLEKLINQYNSKEKENLNSLVKLYSTMKPKDAARIFDNLDLDILVAIIKEMKPTSSSAILSQMQSQKAQKVTAELLGNRL